MASKEFSKELMEHFRWFVDPIPDWIIKDPRWPVYLHETVNFQVAQIDVHMKELALEKARLLKMIPQEANKG